MEFNYYLRFIERGTQKKKRKRKKVKTKRN